MRRKTDASEHIKKNTAHAVQTLMDNRHRLLAPFPIEPALIHREFFNKDEWEAIETLRNINGLVKTYPWMYLIGVPANRKHYRLMIKFELRLPMGDDATLGFPELPEEMQAALLDWMPRTLKLQEETNAVITKVNQLARCCRTFGQVIRVWPEMQGFLGDYARKEVDSAKARSRLPDGVMNIRWDRERHVQVKTLSSEFEPKAFEPFNTMLAEALMLPFVEGEFIATIVE